MRRVSFMLFVAAMLWGAAAAAEPATVMSATHHGVRVGDGIEWRSTYATRGDSNQLTIEFATALASATTFRTLPEWTVTPVKDGSGDVVSVQIAGTRIAGDVPLWVRAPAGRPEPPLAVGAKQRVELRGAEWAPPANSPLELRLTSVRHKVLRSEDEDVLDGRFGSTEESRAVYLIPDAEYVAAGGLAAALNASRTEGRTAIWIGGFMFVLLLLAFVGRALAGRSRVEEAEQFLREFNPLTEG